jgi:hypothetical protein
VAESNVAGYSAKAMKNQHRIANPPNSTQTLIREHRLQQPLAAKACGGEAQGRPADSHPGCRAFALALCDNCHPFTASRSLQ